MQPMRLLWRATADLLAADLTTLANAAAMKMHLAAADFSATLDLALASLTEATFTGSAALSCGTGTQPTYYDAADGFLTLRIKEPAGGWSWVCTVTPGSPETIYGMYLTDSTNAILYAAYKLPQATTISASGQGLSVGEFTMKFRTNSPT